LYKRYRGCTKIEKKREKMKGKYDIMKPCTEKDYEHKKSLLKKGIVPFCFREYGRRFESLMYFRMRNRKRMKKKVRTS